MLYKKDKNKTLEEVHSRGQHQEHSCHYTEKGPWKIAEGEAVYD